jgi:type III secretion protein T
MEKEIYQFGFSWLTASYFAMPRLLAIFSVIPLFNRQALPGLLRVGVAFSIAIFVIPLIEPDVINTNRASAAILFILLKEMIIGLLIGFMISLPLWALDITGVYVDNQRGASIASSINPLTGHDSSPLGELFTQAGIVLLLISGGMMMILKIIYDSYVLWPVFALMPSFTDQMPILLLDLMDRLMRLAVLFSAPVIFSMFLAEIALGLVSRFVPQLQVFFLAMPIKSGIAIFVFAIYTATLMNYVNVELVALPVQVISTLQAIFK